MNSTFSSFAAKVGAEVVDFSSAESEGAMIGVPILSSVFSVVILTS